MNAAAANANVLIISGHDYRTPRWADTHFMAREISRTAPVQFFSLGFSQLSRLKSDPRLTLMAEANRIVNADGIQCYLWKTVVHPVRMRLRVLSSIENLHFRLYRSHPPTILRQWISQAGHIIFDSGASPIFIELAHELNPDATLIYNAADDLATIGCASYISSCLESSMKYIDWVRIPSRTLQPLLPPGARMFHIPHGIDPAIGEQADPSPYGPGLHAVSVGSMLFDPSVFEIASRAFPEITFHVIGPGARGRGLSGPNIRVYGEMRFRDTLPFIKHAALGIAPYRDDGAPAYLADTSMKLQQYGFFGIPAVCPTFATGTDPHRFGYSPGKKDSIIAAIRSAMKIGKVSPTPSLDWHEVAERLLDPSLYPDTALGSS